MKSKKGMWPVVSVALIIIITVVSAIGFQTWFSTFSSGTLTKVEVQSADSVSPTYINALEGSSLFFTNGFDNITVLDVKLELSSCAVNGTYPRGVGEINLSGCTASLTTYEYDIVLITNKGIFTMEERSDTLSISLP